MAEKRTGVKSANRMSFWGNIVLFNRHFTSHHISTTLLQMSTYGMLTDPESFLISWVFATEMWVIWAQYMDSNGDILVRSTVICIRIILAKYNYLYIYFFSRKMCFWSSLTLNNLTVMLFQTSCLRWVVLLRCQKHRKKSSGRLLLTIRRNIHEISNTGMLSHLSTARSSEKSKWFKLRNMLIEKFFPRLVQTALVRRAR